MTSRSVEAAGWRLDMSETMLGGPAGPPPELSSMAIYRGEIAPGCPCVVIAGTRPREGRSLRAEVRRLGDAFRDGVGDGRRVEVRGGRDARRLDGLIDMEERLTDDAIERAAVIVAVAATRSRR